MKRLAYGEVRTVYDVFVGVARIETVRSPESAAAIVEMIARTAVLPVTVKPRMVTPLKDVPPGPHNVGCGCDRCLEPLPLVVVQDAKGAARKCRTYQRRAKAWRKLHGYDGRKGRSSLRRKFKA